MTIDGGKLTVGKGCWHNQLSDQGKHIHGVAQGETVERAGSYQNPQFPWPGDEGSFLASACGETPAGWAGVSEVFCVG